MKRNLGLFKIFNPLFLITKIVKFVKEINNYIFYLQKAKNLQNTGVLRAYNVKLDSFRNMYTAINMKPELLMYYEKQELLRFELEFIGNEFTKLENMLGKNHLLDIITFKHKRILDADHYAYKLISRFRWREISILWVMWYAFYVWGTIKTYQYVHGIDVDAIINYVTNLL